MKDRRKKTLVEILPVAHVIDTICTHVVDHSTATKGLIYSLKLIL